jgi:spermidine/putrescine transport system substrate-binding protein
MKFQKNSGLLFAVVFSMVFAFLGCTPKQNAANSQRVVNLAIWSAYTSPEKIQEFEKKTGIKVQISNYSSNEELLAKLQAGASGYDVAVPSDYMVYAMIKLGLLRQVSLSEFPNAKRLNPKFMKMAFDPENKFSVPYDWGTTGIAVNKALYSGQIKGWKDLFNREDLAGKFSVLDDAREVIGAALKSMGYSMNSRNPAELEKAKELLLRIRSRIKSFTSEPLMPLLNGETAVAHAFMSDALQARRGTKGKVTYILPEEGGTLWIDSLVIPAGAQHVNEAHELINFFLEGASNAATVKLVLAAPANLDAFALLPKELQDDPLLFPAEQALERFEIVQDMGDFLPVWDRIWTEIKASAK